MPRYTKQTWRPGRTGGTPISAARLQHIEDGIEAVDLALDGVDTGAGTVYVPVPGRDGIDGVDGTDGKDGIDGVDGIDGQDGKDAVFDPRLSLVYIAQPEEDITLLDPPLPANTMIWVIPT